MPRLQVQGGNQPPIMDGQVDFGGGQNSFMPARRLQPNECQRLLNCDIRRMGDVVTRRGVRGLGWPAANPILGLGYFDVPGLEKLVRVCAGGVQMHDGDPSHVWQPLTGWDETKWSPQLSAHCSIVQGNNKLFLSTGDGIRVWDGAVFSTMQSEYAEALGCPLLTYATNRLIATGCKDYPDTVWFSNFLEENKWSGEQSLRVGAGDGDPITGVGLWTDRLLVVFKRSSVYIVDIDPMAPVSEFPVRVVSQSIGCVGPRAFAKVGKDLWFYSDYGLRSLSRVLEGQDTEISPAVSYPVSDVIEQVDEARIGEVSAFFYNDVFFLSLPLAADGDAATPVYAVLPVRLVGGAPRWLGQWSGAWARGAALWARSYVGGKQRLNFAVGDRCFQWLDWVVEQGEVLTTFYDGEYGAYPTEVVTRVMSFGDYMLWKQGFTLSAEFNQSRGRVVLSAIRDGLKEAEEVLQGSSGLELGLSFPMQFPFGFAPTWDRIRVEGTLMHAGRFRELAFAVRADSGKMSLRSVEATAFAGSMEVNSRDFSNN